MESAAVCASCGSIGLENGGDGYFYCIVCGFQSQDMLEQAPEDNDFDLTIDRRYVVRCPNADPQSDPDQLSRFQALAAFQRLTQSQPDGYGDANDDDPSKPSLLVDDLPDRPYPFDFAPPSSRKQKEGQPPHDEGEVAALLRSRYAEGLQLMMQMQCEALVQKFGVSPLICGIVAPIWFRFLAASRILEEGWQEEAKLAEEIAAEKRLDTGPRFSLKHRNSTRYNAELRTEYGKKIALIWIRLLKNYTLHSSSRTATPQSLVKGLLHANCSDSDTIDLLHSLETAYRTIISGYDYSKDLPTYLEYCKDIVFAGKTTSYDEENLITQLWDLFKHESEGLGQLPNNEAGCIGSKASVLHGACVGEANHEGTSTKVVDSSGDGMKHQTPRRSKRKNDDVQVLNQTHCQPNSRTRALRCMKSDMEKHGFLYNCFRRRRASQSTYLHYKRILLHGRLKYVVHADYYILLRTCARIVEVDARFLHLGLLKLERRLHWIEKRMHCILPSVFKCTS